MRATVIIAALAASGCSSGTPEPKTHEVVIRGMQFVPGDLVVSRGDIVVWTNEDIVPHTATAAGVFDSQSIASKAQWARTTAEAGVFTYTCTFHPVMKGTLTVR